MCVNKGTEIDQIRDQIEENKSLLIN
jgi:hypothetical protein